MNSNGSIINNFSTFKEINRLTYTKGEYYSSFIILSDGRLAIVSNDKNVEIKNISTNKCDITLVGHTAFIEFISQLSNGKILTSSIEDASKILTLQGDSYTVKKLQLEGYAVRAISNNKIVGWKEDKITVIDSDTFEILNSLKENAYVSNIIELSEEDTIAVRTGNDNQSIWNLKTNQREKTFEVDSDDMKSMIETQNKKLFVGGWGKLTIIDLAKNTIERIIKQTKIHYVDSLIELRDGSVLMGCARGELGLIKQNSDEILYLNVGLKQMSIIRTLLSIDEHTFIFENDKDNLLRIYSY